VDWVLVTLAQWGHFFPQDSGIYECQINTEPKKSKAYVLQVVSKFDGIKNAVSPAKKFMLGPGLPHGIFSNPKSQLG
jgi:hypothetical protein